MSLLPSKPDLVADGEPRVVGVDSDDADALMAALSSGTARRLVAELHDEPAPPAELSERADTTLQNAQYHLSNLEDAGVVEVVGTAYSEKGREMDVYAPADQPLVIFAGEEQQASGIRTALSRLVGGVGALLVGSVAVQEVFGDGIGRFVGFGSSGDAAPPRGGGAPASGTATETPERTTGGEAGAAGGDGSATATARSEDTQTATAQQDGTATAAPDTPDAMETGDAAGAATETVTEEAVAESTRTAASTQTPTPTEVETATRVAADGGVDALTTLPPGALFFLGGLTVLLVGVAVTATWDK